MDAVRTSETSVYFETTRLHIPENGHLQLSPYLLDIKLCVLQKTLNSHLDQFSTLLNFLLLLDLSLHYTTTSIEAWYHKTVQIRELEWYTDVILKKL
jgi:hypothetical protein